MPRTKSSAVSKNESVEAKRTGSDVEDDLLDDESIADQDDSSSWSDDKGMDSKVSRQLQARRRIEDLMEERHMRQLLGDDWNWEIG